MMKTNEDRNVIGVLGGHLEFSVSDSNVSEGSGGAWNGVGGVVGDRSWIGQDLGNQMGISTT